MNNIDINIYYVKQLSDFAGRDALIPPTLKPPLLRGGAGFAGGEVLKAPLCKGADASSKQPGGLFVAKGGSNL